MTQRSGSEKRRRTELVALRLTSSELALLTAEAARSHTSVSALLRERTLASISQPAGAVAEPGESP